MNRRPPHEYEDDDIMQEEQSQPNNTDDVRQDYDDDTLSPIGRLMDDDVGFENEPSAYVSGFSRKPEPEPEAESPTPTRRRRERPGGAVVVPETGFAEDRKERPSRRRPEPVQELASDDDFYEAGIREARRRRPQNPDPRPAVRAAVPTSKRMAQPPPRRQPEPVESDRQPAGAPQEDVYDTFRQRYRGELISSGAGRSAGGERSAARRQPQQGDHVAARARDTGDDASILRFALLGGIFVVLVVLIILIVRINTLANRNSDHEYTIAGMQAAQDRYEDLVDTNAAQDAEIQRQQAEINRLNQELEVLRAENMPGGADGGGQGIGGDGVAGTTPPQTEPPPQWPQTHTIVTGNTLGRIAFMFYGSSDPIYVAHIAQYNNITDPNNIPLGRTITIPAPPGTAQ